jgi:RNA recognition motif-containing protein
MVSVDNLAVNVTEAMLRELMREVGDDNPKVEIIVDRDTGRSKGFAYCHYASSPLAQTAARNLNGRIYYGNTLRVKLVDQRDAQARRLEVVKQHIAGLTGEEILAMPEKEREHVAALHILYTTPPPIPAKQKALLDQMMALTDEEINALPEPERSQVRHFIEVCLGLRFPSPTAPM